MTSERNSTVKIILIFSVCSLLVALCLLVVSSVNETFAVANECEKIGGAYIELTYITSRTKHSKYICFDKSVIKELPDNKF